MKFVLIFLGSVLVVGTHQYFDDQRGEIRWASPYQPHPFIEKDPPYLVYFSIKPNPPAIYPLHDLLPENLAQDARMFYSGDVESVEKLLHDNHNVIAETQPRGKTSLEEVSPRFLFGIEPSTFTNPFGKTATFTVSATVTVSSFVRCIAAAQFQNVAAQGVFCARKRRSLESPETSESQADAIAPSVPQLLATASFPSIGLLKEGRSQDGRTNQQTQQNVIVSSKDETENGPESTTSYANLKNKRFIFFHNKNAYVTSTTVTSLNFITSISTTTANIRVAGALLLCVPIGYRVC
ncbi:uncharacterized protein LOC116935080 [Daphnia magna]|uniref:uncharacterized protein LOC116935080 n=1 Tax=Daphnia magna TaxID=35525 RepID=UPI001E1BCFAC|nr:uncharacterized protein LOC116935080 [Daphnia magna]